MSKATNVDETPFFVTLTSTNMPIVMLDVCVVMCASRHVLVVTVLIMLISMI